MILFTLIFQYKKVILSMDSYPFTHIYGRAKEKTKILIL